MGENKSTKGTDRRRNERVSALFAVPRTSAAKTDDDPHTLSLFSLSSPDHTPYLINRIKASPELTFVEPEKEVVFNVGGQIFETTAGVLTREPFSVLAAYCRVEPIIACEPTSGVFYLERDWWLFRHILTYLRSNVLPNEFETLKELYVEAAYYKLEGLQKAIENLPLSEIKNMSSAITGTYPGNLEGGSGPIETSTRPSPTTGSVFDPAVVGNR